MNSADIVKRLNRMAEAARAEALLDPAEALQVLLRRVDALGDDVSKGLFDAESGAA